MTTRKKNTHTRFMHV